MKHIKFIFTIIWFTTLVVICTKFIKDNMDIYDNKNIFHHETNFKYMKWKLESIDGGNREELFKEYVYSFDNVPTNVKDKIYNNYLEEIKNIK